MSTWSRALVVAAALVSTISVSFSAFSAELDVEKAVQANGNITVTVTNVDADQITVTAMVINRSKQAACNLVPVADNFSTIFLRSDLFTDPEAIRFDDQQQVDAIVLEFGQTVDGLVHESCGKVLYLEIHTDAGIAWFEFAP